MSFRKPHIGMISLSRAYIVSLSLQAFVVKPHFKKAVEIRTAITSGGREDKGEEWSMQVGVD